MPGLPSSSRASQPLPARDPRPSPDPKRMPFHQITATNGSNGVGAGIRDDPNALGGFNDLNCDQSIAERFASQVGSGVHATGHGSAESEHDLAAMVHDFMENGSYGSDFLESSDGENGVSNGPKLFETLQALKFSATSTEKDLLSTLTVLSLAIKEIDLTCLMAGAECKGGCIRRLLVKHLRLSGYDAAVCSSKWQNSGKVPGGEYEYIDVIFDGDTVAGDRLIVDIDFQSQFEIARPTHTYMAALKFLPVTFVGSFEKLGQILQVMAEAAKLSLRQNSMPFPPWRTLDYMTAKWMSPYERKLSDTQGGTHSSSGTSQWRERTRTKQCVEQLRHLKMCIAAETDKNHIGKTTPSDRNRVMVLSKSRRAISGSPSPYPEQNHVTKAFLSEK